MSDLRQRYPSLTNAKTFADVIAISSQYLKTNAVKVAGEHAIDHYLTNPRMSMESINKDVAEAQSKDFLTFLTEKSEKLLNVTIQNVSPLAPSTTANFVSMPPRPPEHTLPNFHTLYQGADIIIPPGFVPDGCPMPPEKPSEYALAVEFIHQSDYEKGLSLVLPHAVACALFEAANLPLNATPNNIVAATGKPQGRLVVDVTRSGLNHPDKKQQLVDLRGPIIYPRHADWCALFEQVANLFPGEQLYMFKADYDRWFKRVRINPSQVGLLAMPFHINGKPFVVIPLVGQFGGQEWNYISSQVSAFIYAKVVARDIQIYRGPVHICYSDDTAGFLPLRLYEEDDRFFTALAEQHAGINAAPPTKKSIAIRQTTVGALYDLHHKTIGLSESIFLKLVCLFFLEIPQQIIPGTTRVSVKCLQRMGSYMILAASFLPSLKPFTHGVFQNTAGIQHTTRSVRISHRSYIDILFWRTTLFSTTISTKWLSVPIHIPPMVSRQKDRCKHEFAVYQAHNSNIIVGTDACTGAFGSPTWGGGWTANYANQSTSMWGMYQPSTFEAFLRSINLQPSAEELSTIDQINLYEAITVVLACEAILQSLPPDRGDHITLFVWCDNTSAIAWLSNNKSNHPIINFLLQVWARLQATHNCTINTGHIPGIFNIIPDAISRQFLVEGGSEILRKLSHMTPHTSLPNWFRSMLHSSATPLDQAWQSTAQTLIALVKML